MLSGRAEIHFHMFEMCPDGACLTTLKPNVLYNGNLTGADTLMNFQSLLHHDKQNTSDLSYSQYIGNMTFFLNANHIER